MPQKSFSGGVISPRLWQQVDLVKYQSGLATCKNVLPIKEGGLLRRPGTEFIYEAFRHDRPSRLFKFIFSDEDTYIIELSATDTGGQATFRFFRNGEIIETSEGSGIPYEVLVDDYIEDDIFRIKALQQYDYLFLFLNKYQTKTLRRLDATHRNWSMENNAWTDNTPPKMPDDADPPVEQDVYPGTGTFFQNRLLLGGFEEYPVLVMGSVADNIFNFDKNGSNDAKAFAFDIISTDYNLIYWFNVVQNKVLIGTINSEKLMAGTTEGAITGTDTNPPQFLANSAFGSSEVIAEAIGDTVLAAQAPGYKLRNYTYAFEQDKYVGVDLNRLTEHLTKDSSIKELAYQANPEQVIWVLRNNGVLQTLTYVPEEEVYAWAVHEISDGDRPASVESIEVIPSGSDEDEIWLCVKRIIEGEEKRYIERLTRQVRTGLQILPSFSPAWGPLYQAPLEITIIWGSVPGDLYYTLDGSTPSSENGTKFLSPFCVENPTTIKVADASNNVVTGFYTFAGDRLYDSASDPLFDSNSDPLFAVSAA